MRGLVERARHIERSQGEDQAASFWREITRAYPWSLGILEDRISFLDRAGRRAELLDLLEEVAPKAADGYRRSFLSRLARKSIELGEWERARGALTALLNDVGLAPRERVTAVGLVGKVAFRSGSGVELDGLAREQAARLPADSVADMFAELARAAAEEDKWGRSARFWLEAIERRTDRNWLRSACVAAESSGLGSWLVEQVERRQRKSSRDVRWAVALRDVRLYFHDLDGAVEMAGVAARIRPERDTLWKEGADLMARRGDRLRRPSSWWVSTRSDPPASVSRNGGAICSCGL